MRFDFTWLLLFCAVSDLLNHAVHPYLLAAGEFKDTSQDMKRFFIGFMPVGIGVIYWIEYAGLDWGRVGSNFAYAAFGSLILALIHKFSQP